MAETTFLNVHIYDIRYSLCSMVYIYIQYRWADERRTRPIVKHPRTNPCIRARMWEKLRSYFKGYPAQEKVAHLMLVHGLRVRDGRVFAGPMEVSDTAMARAASVDRRVVTATVKTIESNAELLKIFERLAPVCHPGEGAPPL